MPLLSIPAATVAAAETYARDLELGYKRLPTYRTHVDRDHDALFAHGRYSLDRGAVVEKVYLLSVDATTPDEVSTQAQLVATIYGDPSIFDQAPAGTREPVSWALRLEVAHLKPAEASAAAEAIAAATERLEHLRRALRGLASGDVDTIEKALERAAFGRAFQPA